VTMTSQLERKGKFEARQESGTIGGRPREAKSGIIRQDRRGTGKKPMEKKNAPATKERKEDRFHRRLKKRPPYTGVA